MVLARIHVFSRELANFEAWLKPLDEIVLDAFAMEIAPKSYEDQMERKFKKSLVSVFYVEIIPYVTYITERIGHKRSCGTHLPETLNQPYNL